MWQRFDELPILIAEDSEDDLILLQRGLRKAGVVNPQTVTETGRETIEYLERAHSYEPQTPPFPVVLFLDLLMPRGDGMEVLQWLHDHTHPPVAIVLHTGVEDDAQLQQARDLGANYHLPKGARPEAVHEVFHRARAEWEQHHLLEH
jgi:CheY-like chemotaxis protein